MAIHHIHMVWSGDALRAAASQGRARLPRLGHCRLACGLRQRPVRWASRLLACGQYATMLPSVPVSGDGPGVAALSPAWAPCRCKACRRHRRQRRGPAEQTAADMGVSPFAQQTGPSLPVWHLTSPFPYRARVNAELAFTAKGWLGACVRLLLPMILKREGSFPRESRPPSVDRVTATTALCRSCGVLAAAPHGTDADCIAALRQAIDNYQPRLRRTA